MRKEGIASSQSGAQRLIATAMSPAVQITDVTSVKNPYPSNDVQNIVSTIPPATIANEPTRRKNPVFGVT